MGCKECGKPKCNGECGCKSPKVLQINNPAEYITFHKVSIPAAMGDSTTNPPKIGAYRNALVYYEADHTSWMYSTDGIPTLITGEKGETGPQGPQGIQGPIGPAGADGESFTPVVVSSLPSTGTEGKLYLTPKAHTTQTATGNPITATVAEEAGMIESFQLDGDTYQQTYTGKNLLDYTDAAYPVSKNGLVATLNSDGSITVTGTPNANFVIFVSQDMTDLLEDGATYTMSSDSYSADFYIDLVATRIGGGMSYPANTRSGSASFTVDKSTFSRYTINIQTYTTASWGASSKTITREFQIEKSATATSFEPFVGGQPSPSPDYPQPIQTVTGLQTVEVRSKNLLPTPGNGTAGGITRQVNSDGTLSLRGTAVMQWPSISRLPYSLNTTIPSGTTLTLSLSKPLPNGWRLYFREYYGGGGGNFINHSIPNNGTHATFTTSGDMYGAGLVLQAPSIGATIDIDGVGIQLEVGQTATAFVPYSKQTYTLNLGSIELCKLGDYHDYIWKDGEDWKVRKATKTELLDGSETWEQDSNGGFQRFNITRQDAIQPSGRTAIGLSSHFISKTTNGIGIFFLASTESGATRRFFFYPESSITTVESFKSWLNSNKTTLVYPLATSTDTTITDTTLIAQLEAIRTASLQNGANTITNTATGSNLAGDMGIGYYGYNPRNRYDKWLWLDINNEYEQIGS